MVKNVINIHSKSVSIDCDTSHSRHVLPRRLYTLLSACCVASAITPLFLAMVGKVILCCCCHVWNSDAMFGKVQSQVIVAIKVALPVATWEASAITPLFLAMLVIVIFCCCHIGLS